MFLEPRAQRTVKIQRSETPGFVKSHVTLLRRYGVFVGNLSYRHLAALRPSHDLG